MTHATPHTVINYGERGWMISWPGDYDRMINQKVHHLSAYFSQHSQFKFAQIVPGYQSILLLLPSIPLSLADHQKIEAALFHEIEAALDDYDSFNGSKIVDPPTEIPVYYTDKNTDLEAVCRICGLTVDEVIAIHSSTIYQVYLLGFMPGFAYLGELPAALHLPRKSNITQVAAGAVAIAHHQTGIYPYASPGGWHVLGHTPYRLFDVNKNPPVLLQPGISIKFKPIQFEEYQQLRDSWVSKL